MARTRTRGPVVRREGHSPWKKGRPGQEEVYPGRASGSVRSFRTRVLRGRVLYKRSVHGQRTRAEGLRAPMTVSVHGREHARWACPLLSLPVWSADRRQDKDFDVRRGMYRQGTPPFAGICRKVRVPGRALFHVQEQEGQGALARTRRETGPLTVGKQRNIGELKVTNVFWNRCA